jgi:hypothetical protein
MSNASLKSLSEFGQTAVALDSDFQEIERLASELGRIDLQSDSGLERAKKLLVHFTECGQRAGEELKKMASALEVARIRAEKASAAVAERAVDIQRRQEASSHLLSRFQALGNKVRQVTVAASQLQVPAEKVPNEQKGAVVQFLPELDMQLAELVEESRQLKADARGAKEKALERDAEAMEQSLQAVRRKLSSFVHESRMTG